MQRVFVRGLVGGWLAAGVAWLVSGQSWPDLRSLVGGGCLAVGTVRPVSTRSLVDRQWLAAATPAAVRARLEHGASLTVRDEDSATSLHLAAWTNEDLAVVALLLDRGADLTARDDFGSTPLHEAARANRNLAVAALLLDHGADATLRDKADRLPLDYADENEALKGTDVYRWLHDAQS